MLATLAYYPILGFPLIFYLGILTYISFLFTASVGYFYFTGRPILPFKWHPRMAVISLILGLIHGALAASAYFNY
ncbi:hypothetical protein M1349_01555 [Patescibacteria group bacterium]|nr:hypothetical protein [Patescibacteria group bacterium]